MSVSPDLKLNLLILLTMTLLLGCSPAESSKAPASPEKATKVTENEMPTSGMTGKKPVSVRNKMDLEAVKAAKKLVCESAMQIGFMADDAAFERSFTGEGNALGKIDVAASLQALDLLGTLPDNTENEFIEPLSKVLPKIRECLEIYRNAAGKKPFADGTGIGPKMAKLGADNHLSLSVAVDESSKLVDPK